MSKINLIMHLKFRIIQILMITCLLKNMYKVGFMITAMFSNSVATTSINFGTGKPDRSKRLLIADGVELKKKEVNIDMRSTICFFCFFCSAFKLLRILFRTPESRFACREPVLLFNFLWFNYEIISIIVTINIIHSYCMFTIIRMQITIYFI